jgi:hypothetical protein
MRHLGSIALSIVLAPVIYVLAGLGTVKLEAGIAGDNKWTNIAIGAVALLAASGAFAVLVMPKLSPLGPVFAGLIFFVLSAWAIASPNGITKILKPSTLDGALVAPLGTLTLFVCVPLFATIFSPRRWRGADKPALVGTGYPNYQAPQASGYLAPTDPYGQPAPANPYAAQNPYGAPSPYPPQDPYGAGTPAPTYPEPAATPAPTAVMPQTPGPEPASYGAPTQAIPDPAMYGAPAPAASTYGAPAPAASTYGAPAPAASTYGAPIMPAAAPIASPDQSPASGQPADMYARTQVVTSADLPPAPPVTSAPPVIGAPSVTSAPPVSSAPPNVYGQPAAAAYNPPTPGVYGQQASPGFGEQPVAHAPAEQAAAAGASYGQASSGEQPAPNVYGQPAPQGEQPAPNVYGQPASPGEQPAPNVYGQPASPGEQPAPNVYGQPTSTVGEGAPSQPGVYGQPAAPEQVPSTEQPAGAGPAVPGGPIYPQQTGPAAAPDSDATVVDAPIPHPEHMRPE